MAATFFEHGDWHASFYGPNGELLLGPGGEINPRGPKKWHILAADPGDAVVDHLPVSDVVAAIYRDRAESSVEKDGLESDEAVVLLGWGMIKLGDMIWVGDDPTLKEVLMFRAAARMDDIVVSFVHRD